MDRTITVKGTGSISVKPDTIIISLNITALDKDYKTASDTCAQKHEALKNALSAAGFDTSALKTAGYNVNTEYEGRNDANGNYVTVFAGYRCSHRLNFELETDYARLGEALFAISSGVSEPELQIRFTVKDKETAADVLLRSAAESARHKAEILCAASGAALGELLSIDYDRNNANMFSETSFDCAAPMMAKACLPDISPEDISLTDSAVFTWSIE